MFDYEKFKEELKQQLIHHMSLPFADGEVVFAVKEKDGVQKEGFYIKRQDNEEGVFMLLEPVYDKIYKNTCQGDFDKTIKNVSLLYEKQSEQIVNDVFMLNIKDNQNKDSDILFDVHNIFFCVVGKESNEAYMTDIPHQDKGNISMYLRLLVSDDGEYMNSIIIDKDMLNQIEDKGMDFNTLISYAVKNTPQLFPAQVNKIDDEMYVISNESYSFGASTLFYPESPLEFIVNNSDTLKNLIILPCSNDFCVAFAAQTPAIANEEIYKKYNHAIKVYAKSQKESALAAYPFVYDSTQKRMMDKGDILKDILDVKNSLDNDTYNNDFNNNYRKKERSL